MALQIADMIYIRSSSSSIFSDVVHEEPPVLDYLNDTNESVISSWIGETKAYSEERLFQIESGLPVQLESENDMMVHIWNNYKR